MAAHHDSKSGWREADAVFPQSHQTAISERKLRLEWKIFVGESENNALRI